MSKWGIRALCTLLFSLLICLLCYGVDRFYHKVSDGFSLENVISLTTPSTLISVEEQVKIEEILKQRFYYLAKGGQSFAFLSENGQYVLKFFKRNTKKRKQPFAMSSAKLAYEKLREESGVLFLHLNSTVHQLPVTKIVNKLGFEILVEMDKMAFYIQQRAQLISQKIAFLSEQNDREGISQVFSKLFEIIRKMDQKGIIDLDDGMVENLGFIKDRVMIIDIGRLAEKKAVKRTELYLVDLEKRADRFRIWLRKHFPELIPLFDETLKKELNKA